MNHTHQLLIDGKLVDSDLTLEVIDPSTGSTYLRVPRATAEQAQDAVRAAKDAFAGWRDTPLSKRRSCVERLASGIEARREDFAQALTAEQGKPIEQARDEVDWTVGFLRGYAQLDVPVEVVYEDDHFRMETHHRPLGVVVGIAPWNFPLFLLTLKLGAAVLTGNTFIAKPAPTTPVTILMVGEVAASIFPAGVVNVLVDANDLGPLLVAHPDVAKISFTGSTATGKKIAAAAAASLKRVSLELGGNDAAIVLDDVDVDDVAQKLYDAAFLNSGQVCIAVKRIYTHTDVYDSLADALGKIARSSTIGRGVEGGVDFGPIQNSMQFDKAKEFLRAAQQDGVIVEGGEPIDRDGYYIPPTIVRDIDDSSELVAEEQFSPILPLVRFESLETVVDTLNASPYGLGGSVWSGDEQRAYELAQRLDTGTVWVNHHLHLHPSVPVAGAKSSGNGADYGVEGLKQYLQPTVIRRIKQ